MTYLVDDLEAAGLVERQADAERPAQQADRRDRHGRATWCDAAAPAGQAEDHVLAPLSAADRNRFRDLLRTLATRAQTLDPVADACEMVEELDGPRPRHSARR